MQQWHTLGHSASNTIIITNTVLLEGTKPMPCITAVTNGLVLELYGVYATKQADMGSHENIGDFPHRK